MKVTNKKVKNQDDFDYTLFLRLPYNENKYLSVAFKLNIKFWCYEIFKKIYPTCVEMLISDPKNQNRTEKKKSTKIYTLDC